MTASHLAIAGQPVFDHVVNPGMDGDVEMSWILIGKIKGGDLPLGATKVDAFGKEIPGFVTNAQPLVIDGEPWTEFTAKVSVEVDLLRPQSL